MTTYTEIFGGGTIYPAEPTFLALTYSTDQTLVWPIEQSVGGDDIVAKIIELHPSTSGLSVTLPDATLISTGFTALFYNAEADTTIIKDDGGTTLLTVASGEAWTIYLRDNSTANGLWRSFQQGAGTSSANAGALAGSGLKAISATLNTDMPPSAHPVNYAIVNADRANPQVWTGGVGTFTLPDPATVGAGWYVPIANQGSGSVTITPASGTIDLSGSLILAVGESAFAVSDGTNYFTVGLGQEVNSIFDFISIAVAGTGNYTLSGAELNRVAYVFTGILTGNRVIIVPATVQQYWVTNSTTGSFTLTVKTAAGTGVQVAQGTRAILYCDGTNVVNADDASSISFPITPSQGGTGITSYTQGDTLYASAGTVLSVLAKSASATRYVSNTGANNNPAWAQVDLTNGVSGILPVANGGLGSTLLLSVANGGTGLDGIRAAKVTKSASQTLPYVTGTVITWDGEITDQGGWHDNVTNNSRLTVPAGIGWIRLEANICFDLGISNYPYIISVYFVKNGNLAVGLGNSRGFSTAFGVGRFPTLYATTGFISCGPGDYFEAAASITSNTVGVGGDVLNSTAFGQPCWYGVEGRS